MRMKRLLSAFLALVMVMSMVAVPVSAEDTVPCTKTVGCTLAEGHTETECSVPSEPSEEPTAEPETTAAATSEPVVTEACEKSDGCTYGKDHQGNCSGAPYCENEKCTIRGAAHGACKVPEEPIEPSTEPSVPAEYCTTEGCILRTVETHDTCKYCSTVGCNVVRVHTEEDCFVPCDEYPGDCALEKGHTEACQLGCTCPIEGGKHVKGCTLNLYVETCAGDANATECNAATHQATCAMFQVKDEATLKAALAAGMTTITLAADITTGEMFRIEKGLTINGNGNTITATRSDSTPFFVAANEEVSFENLTITGSGTMYGIYSSQTAGSLNLKEVTISGQSHYAVVLNGDTTANPSVTLNVTDSDLTGYSAISVWTPNADVNVEGSTLGSSNAWGNPSSNSYATVSAHVACDINITESTIKASAASGSVQSAIGTSAGVSGVTITMDKDSRLELSGEGETYLLGAELADNTFVFPAAYAAALGDEGCMTETYTDIDGTVKVTGAAVAKDSSGKLYADLQTAVNAGGTITVLYDHEVSETVTIAEGKTVVLDLNGKTVTLPGIENNGNLTVNNGALVGNIYQDVIVSYGTLTVDDVTASGTRHVLRVKEGTAIIEGGTFTALGTADTTCHVLNVGDDNTNATVTVNGGTFIGAEGKDVDSTAAISVQNESKVTVKDGSFSKGMSGNTVDLFVVAEAAELELTGGTYDADVNDYCAADYKAAKKNDTTWEVVPKVYVAQIGTGEDIRKFETIQEAVAAAGENDVITLIADGEISLDKTETIEIAKKVTIALNGKSINAGGDAFTVVTGGDLTINGNGTVKAGTAADNDYCAVWTNGGGNATINGGTYSVGAKSGDYNDLIYAKGGSITITGGYFNCENTQWSNNNKYYVLNQNNTNRGTISVKGGIFEKYNPADGDDAVENDTFVAAGFCAATSDNGETYTIGTHARVKVDAVKATCLQDGNIEHYKCDNCGTLYKTETGDETLTEEEVKTTCTQDIVKVSEVKATCLQDGNIAHYKCNNCGTLYKTEAGDETLTEEDIKTTCDGERVKVDEVKATCLEDGNIEHYECSSCGTLFKSATGDQTLTAAQVKTTGKHDIAFQAEVPATYDGDGIKEHYYCKTEGCGKKFTDAKGTNEFTGSAVIDKLSNVVDGVLVIEPDAIENEDATNVVLDLVRDEVHEDKLTNIQKVSLPTDCVEAHAEDGGTLMLILSDAEVFFDAKALSTIVSQATGDEIILVVDEITKTDTDLTAKQKTTLNGKKDPYLIRLQLWSNDKPIGSSFGGGKVYVYLTGFEPKFGYKASNYSAFFLDEDGTTDSVSYYSRDVRLTVEHFSEYFLARNTKAASNAATGDTSNILMWGAVGLFSVAALVVVLILMRKKKQ